ncbi:MAG: sulfotransferase [Pseudomonadota bacterium]
MAKPFRVVGIGLNKTGTTSLKLALTELGWRHMKRTPRLFKHWRQGNLDALFAEAEAFESFEDWPWPLAFREAYARWGDGARYILTRRKSPEAWVESLKRHALRTPPDRNPRKRIFGHDYPHGKEAEHIVFYQSHLEEVRAFFAAPERRPLFAELSWDDGDGWAELCAFLREQAPDLPFPHGNRALSDAEIAPEILAENRRRIALQTGG